jgi:hypothetical protein
MGSWGFVVGLVSLGLGMLKLEAGLIRCGKVPIIPELRHPQAQV